MLVTHHRVDNLLKPQSHRRGCNNELLCRGVEQGQGSYHFGDAAQELIKRTPAMRSVGAQTSPMSAAESPMANDMCTMDSLIREVATPRTRATLEEYEGENKVRHSLPMLQSYLRSISTTKRQHCIHA